MNTLSRSLLTHCEDRRVRVRTRANDARTVTAVVTDTAPSELAARQYVGPPPASSPCTTDDRNVAAKNAI